MSDAAADLAAPGVRDGRACAGCLRRTWLLGRLAGHLDQVRDRIDALLQLGDAANEIEAAASRCFRRGS